MGAVAVPERGVGLCLSGRSLKLQRSQLWWISDGAARSPSRPKSTQSGLVRDTPDARLLFHESEFFKPSKRVRLGRRDVAQRSGFRGIEQRLLVGGTFEACHHVERAWSVALRGEQR